MSETGCKAKGLKTNQTHEPQKETAGKTEEKASIDTVKQTC